MERRRPGVRARRLTAGCRHDSRQDAGATTAVARQIYFPYSGITDISSDTPVRSTKQAYLRLPIILLATHLGVACDGVDHPTSSHSPERLLGLLRDQFGNPRKRKHEPDPPAGAGG